jgi:hypothetical protein
LALIEVELPLFNEPDYIYQVSLEDNSYSLRFTYNQVMKLTTLSIYDVDQKPVCCGVGLVPNYPIILSYALPELTGAFIMASKAAVDTEFYKIYPENLATYYTLSYIRNETV